MITETLKRIPGDRATYSQGDGPGAVALARSAGRVAVDIETAGLDRRRWQVKAVTIGTDSHAIVLDPATDAPSIRAALAAAKELVFHGSSYDVPILYAAGMFALDWIAKVHDTLVQARLAEPGERTPKTLGACCDRWLATGYAPVKASLESTFRGVESMTKAQMFEHAGLGDPAYVAYAANDVIMTARLAVVLPKAVSVRMSGHLLAKYAGDPQALSEREQLVNRIMLARSCRGIGLDEEVVEELQDELRAVIALAEESLEISGIYVGAGYVTARRQVIDRLDTEGRLAPSWPRNMDGSPSARKELLAQLEHPMVTALRDWGEAQHFLNDYAEKLLGVVHPSTGLLHPQVNVLAASTGRSSMSAPPLQQYPDRIRRMMRDTEPLTSFDWVSIEPAFAANAAGDRTVVDTYEAGGDLYAPLARAAQIPRKVAKTTLLATLYGQGAPALSRRLGVPEGQARLLREKVMAEMPRVDAMIRRLRSIGDEHGFTLTVSGRVLPLEKDPRTGNREFLGYKAGNYFIQGSCYDLLAEALVALYRQGLSRHLFVAVHDELVVHTSVAAEVAQIMATPPPALIELAGRTPVLRVDRHDLDEHWSPKIEELAV